ncbi:MAG: YbfB/YjiJ family MFS transporter [Pseudomonadota bacterium]|nr:YbfB/YjiJ family MFS transporter [Pseudomonadota bacterium]
MTAFRIALAGLVALAVAMGIGRFAFTPILPMMLHDGVLDLAGASWLASANYLGYLAGALFCTFEPRLRARLKVTSATDGPAMVRAGLAATVLLTLGMALPLPALWPALRFAAGVASALVFIHASAWCLAQVAARGAPALGGVMFAGPGAGIVASGLMASLLVALQGSAAIGWVVFAALALALTASVWGVFRPSRQPVTAALSPGSDSAALPALGLHGRPEVATLAFAYGLAGFGYIISATFLPVIARVVLPGSVWLDLFWPVFGVGVIVGALWSSRLRRVGDLRLLLAAAYGVQAAGIVIGIGWQTAAGFAFGSFLLGMPLTTITFFAMQEVRRVRPLQVASTAGLVTAVYGIGQIVGPPMVAALLHRSADRHAAFTLSLWLAAASLVLGAIVFFAASRVWPLRSVAGASTSARSS